MKERKTEVTPAQERLAHRRLSHSRTMSTPAARPTITDERQPLLRRRRSFEEHHDMLDALEAHPVAGGTTFGYT